MVNTIKISLISSLKNQERSIQLIAEIVIQNRKMGEITIKKAKIKDANIIVDLVTELLIGFNNQSNSTFIIDNNKLDNVSKKLIVRDNFGAFIAYTSNNEPKGIIIIS